MTFDVSVEPRNLFNAAKNIIKYNYYLTIIITFNLVLVEK